MKRVITCVRQVNAESRSYRVKYLNSGVDPHLKIPNTEPCGAPKQRFRSAKLRENLPQELAALGRATMGQIAL